MIQQRQGVQEARTVTGGVDAYLEELRNDHLGLVGGSPAMVALRDLIRRVATSARPVLISGPTGAGKSLVAEAIHRLGGQAAAEEVGANNGSLARVNCAEVDERNLEQILFGTERHPGLLAAAGATTLVLEDVHALPEGLQAKMVRLLQTGAFRPVGSAVQRRVSIRVLAITSRSLARCVRENTFRADLLYELGVLTISVPGLDEHRDDIPALVNHFLRLGASPTRLSADALDVLAGRRWPGAVRELRNLVERAVVQSRDQVIGPETVRSLCAPEPVEGAIEDSLALLAGRLLELPIGNKLAAVEAALLESAMRASQGNKSGAARLLGLHRKAVERKLEKYEMRFGMQAPLISERGAGAQEMGGESETGSEADIIVRRTLESLHLQG
ncbi:MAG: sigma 54-interacting transcriptional regulator [Bacteroidota bacterium]